MSKRARLTERVGYRTTKTMRTLTERRARQFGYDTISDYIRERAESPIREEMATKKDKVDDDKGSAESGV